MRWAPRTLKGQLTVLFLLFTLAPSLILTAVAARELFYALSQWQKPGVQRALVGSGEVVRDLRDRTKNDLRQRGQLLAADPAMKFSLDAVDEDAVRTRLATAYNLDFVQVYTTEGEFLFEITRDPLLSGLGPIPDPVAFAEADNSFMESDSLDVIVYVGYAGAPGEGEWILTAGIYLTEGFYQRLGDLNQGIIAYRRLPTLIRVRQRVVVLILGGLLTGLALVSIWSARRLAGRVSQPVESLGAGMERVSRGEDAVHVPPHGTQETEHLIETFNLMSTELSRSRRELAQAERLSTWRDVARRVAHEIKNALTPITFSAHRLRQSTPQLPVAEQERFTASLNTVLDEVEGLKRLAASFSELARLPVPELAPVDVRELVSATASAFLEEKRELEIDLPSGPVTVSGDRALLRQALTNLIKNAVEATKDGERIWVYLSEDADEARITVEDSGTGWPEDRHRMMDPYVTSKTYGTGLGLSLVQRTVFQHGGRVVLEDRPGTGARVTLFLPKQEAPDLTKERS